MKVSGFTFVRNANKFGYPIIESIQSMLPLCDEVVVAVGDSQDGTLDLIHNIGSNKIKIIETIWDDELRQGGHILAQQTNIALSHCQHDWCFYLQADEVIHEQFYPEIQEVMEKYFEDHRVQGLLFDYVHFYGSYWTIGTGRNWYRREIRIIRNHIGIQSYRDAQGFRLNGKKIRVKHTDAQIFHYGWAKPANLMTAKQRNLDRFWHSDDAIEKKYTSDDFHIYEKLAEVERFKGTHPEVMADRISNAPSSDNHPDILIGKGKKGLLRWLEQDVFHTRFGEYKNYKLI